MYSCIFTPVVPKLFCCGNIKFKVRIALNACRLHRLNF